jgi:hypothetical protein
MLWFEKPITCAMCIKGIVLDYLPLNQNKVVNESELHRKTLNNTEKYRVRIRILTIFVYFNVPIPVFKVYICCVECKIM